jgi:hypothetical protein
VMARPPVVPVSVLRENIYIAGGSSRARQKLTAGLCVNCEVDFSPRPIDVNKQKQFFSITSKDEGIKKPF